MGGLHDAQEQENVNVVGPKLPQPLLEGLAQVRATQAKIKGARGDHALLPLRGRQFAEHPDHLLVPAVTEEKIDPRIERTADHVCSGAVARREPKA